jgi:hypothetical protein
MSGHTPGPWAVINSTGVFSALGSDSGDGTQADSNDGWNICDCSVGVTAVDGEYVELGFGVQKANARLISMSPQLLLALVDAADIFRGLADAVPLLKERSEAYDHLIAKARGDYE